MGRLPLSDRNDFFRHRRLKLFRSSFPSRLRSLPPVRVFLTLLLVLWLFVTFDSFALHWLWWILTAGPSPADPALSHACPSADYRLPLAVVVPLIAKHASRVEWTLARWADPRFAPCALDEGKHNATLVFYFDRPLSEPATALAVAKVRNAVQNGPASAAVSRCFLGVRYESARLSARETRNSYAMDVVRNIVQTAGSNTQWEKAFQVLGGGTYRHMLYMEPDTWPIRSGWLGKVLQESTWGPFWMRGTSMRYAPKFNIGLEPFRSHYQRHLNGNAIYKLDDRCFSKYRELSRRQYGNGAFDVAMTHFRLGMARIMTFQEVAHRFQLTELMVDIGVTEVGEDELLRRFPGTYLVHGKYMHVKHPGINFMQYR